MRLRNAMGLVMGLVVFAAGVVAGVLALGLRQYPGYRFLLAIGLTLVTVNYQHASKLFCAGDLGAGFPAAFLCDALGESPISNWGKISWTDIPNVLGGYLDILFFATLLWAIFLAAKKIFHWRTSNS